MAIIQRIDHLKQWVAGQDPRAHRLQKTHHACMRRINVLRPIKRRGITHWRRRCRPVTGNQALLGEERQNAFGTGFGLGFTGIGHAAQLDRHRQAGQRHRRLRKLSGQLHPGQGTGFIERTAARILDGKRRAGL